MSRKKRETGKTTEVLQQEAWFRELEVQNLAVASTYILKRPNKNLVRVPCDTTIYEVCSTLQFGLYSGGAGDGAGTGYRSEF